MILDNKLLVPVERVERSILLVRGNFGAGAKGFLASTVVVTVPPLNQYINIDVDLLWNLL